MVPLIAEWTAAPPVLVRDVLADRRLHQPPGRRRGPTPSVISTVSQRTGRYAPGDAAPALMIAAICGPRRRRGWRCRGRSGRSSSSGKTSSLHREEDPRRVDEVGAAGAGSLPGDRLAARRTFLMVIEEARRLDGGVIRHDHRSAPGDPADRRHHSCPCPPYLRTSGTPPRGRASKGVEPGRSGRRSARAVCALGALPGDRPGPPLADRLLLRARRWAVAFSEVHFEAGRVDSGFRGRHRRGLPRGRRGLEQDDRGWCYHLGSPPQGGGLLPCSPPLVGEGWGGG